MEIFFFFTQSQHNAEIEEYIAEPPPVEPPAEAVHMTEMESHPHAEGITTLERKVRAPAQKTPPSQRTRK